MPSQIPLDRDNEALDLRAHVSDPTHEVAVDVAYNRLAIVNVAFVGSRNAGDRGWVMVDTGIPGTAGVIENAAADRFGEGARPAAIVQTHGHFDHVGALKTLSEAWDCPVICHRLEAPYLDGSASYPPADPSVGGGLMAWTSKLYPRGPVNVRERLVELSGEEGDVPHLKGWRYVLVPGHTPGQIALWRQSDGILIAADAFVTTKQESAYAVAVQAPEMHGPPMYYTQDFVAAAASVRRLAALKPRVVVTGHGRPMQGPEMLAALQELAGRFEDVAVPKSGKYVMRPARAEDGSAYPKP